MKHALVIGAGIGGLTAAIALQQVGWRVSLYERASRPREVGAGITLWPNALKALRKLGVEQAICAHGVTERQSAIREPNGNALSQTPISALTHLADAPFVALHRADLHQTLLNAANIEPQCGMSCTGFTQDAHGVTAIFANGQSVAGDVLIGADGIRSAVRLQMHPRSQPRYAGYTAWRSVVTLPRHASPLSETSETWGRGIRFGIVPLDARRVYWFAVRDAPEGEADLPIGRKAELLALFGAWHQPIRQLIEATDEASILRNDIHDLTSLSLWGEGRVTLLGDAAHAMTPNLGQGACQAIEDAVVLANSLQSASDVATALRGYEKRRMAHTTQIVRTARQLGELGRWRHPIACWLRTQLFKRMPARLQLAQLRWIVAHEV